MDNVRIIQEKELCIISINAVSDLMNSYETQMILVTTAVFTTQNNISIRIVEKQ